MFLTTLVENQIPHTGFRENSYVSSRTFPVIPGDSTAPAGFSFSPTDTLVTVMNDDQTNGTFVLPAGTADTILTAASESNFTGINLSGIYGTILNDTDRELYEYYIP